MNDNVVKFLTEYKVIYGSIGDIYREAAYTKAIPVIRRLNYKITKDNAASLSSLRGIGKSITEKVLSFLNADTTDLENLIKSPKVMAHRELGSILGVGPKTIDKWINMKVTTISKLRKAVADGVITLNSAQKEGLKYYEDLKKRIPRSEVKIIGAVIEKTFKDVIDMHGVSGNMEIVGSYRRGSPDSGDIDIIMTTNHHKPLLLGSMKLALAKYKSFVAAIATGRERTTILIRGPTNIVRQIDLLYVKEESYPAALLYFTGGWEFNEYMRGFAKSKGYRLNQNGLFSVERSEGKSGVKLVNIPVGSEKEIFDTIGLKYLDPKYR